MNSLFTRYFYAVALADHARQYPDLFAFTTKNARDAYVDAGKRRFAKLRREADFFCKRNFQCDARTAVMRGYVYDGQFDYDVELPVNLKGVDV